MSLMMLKRYHNPVCVTGHRPDKLGGFRPHVQRELYLFAREVVREIDPTYVVTGMAQGWDLAIAKACINLGIDFHAYVPFEGQELIWPEAAQEEYHHVLSFASNTVVVSEGGYSPKKMFLRNYAMVDATPATVALWNGDRIGGTWDAVQYTEEVNHDLINVWKYWQDFKKGLTRRTP